MMTVPKFKTDDIISYPYNNSDRGHYLISGAEEPPPVRGGKWNIYSAIVLYECGFIHQQDRCEEQITLDMETVDRYSALEA